jgi:hypothetical protein
MGLFDRDTDMSDDEGADDGPAFEPVPGTEGDASEGSDAGADGPPSTLVGADLRDDDFSGTLKRAVDAEAGVVLYAYNYGNAGGLTAVPIDRTRLGDE